MRLKWLSYLVIVMFGLIAVGTVAKVMKKSVVSPEARFNLVYIDQGGSRVSVATFDPVEEKVMIITYPETLAITSRSVGEYEIGSLYKLGSYKNQGGEFARRKVQGFMKLPIVGYLINLEGEGSVDSSLSSSLYRAMWRRGSEDNLTLFDAYRLSQSLRSYGGRLVAREDLVRAGVIVTGEKEKLSYAPLALSNYVGKSFFDWGVGKEGVTVSIINESGESGLGSDMAQFLDNMGLDVITVRSGSQVSDVTRIIVAESKNASMTLTLMERVFRFKPYEIGDTAEYRAGIVMWVGRDALELF